MAKSLPKTLFIKIADGGTGPDYFEADTSLIGMVETGETIRAGVYELKGIEIVRGIVSRQKIKK